MENKTTDILAEVAEHCVTPRGVDWNGEESQVLRFEQPSKVIHRPGGFSLNDLVVFHAGGFNKTNLEVAR